MPLKHFLFFFHPFFSFFHPIQFNLIFSCEFCPGLQLLEPSLLTTALFFFDISVVTKLQNIPNNPITFLLNKTLALSDETIFMFYSTLGTLLDILALYHRMKIKEHEVTFIIPFNHFQHQFITLHSKVAILVISDFQNWRTERDKKSWVQ